jgi:hypothetical protein
MDSVRLPGRPNVAPNYSFQGTVVTALVRRARVASRPAAELEIR